MHLRRHQRKVPDVRESSLYQVVSQARAKLCEENCVAGRAVGCLVVCWLGRLIFVASQRHCLRSFDAVVKQISLVIKAVGKHLKVPENAFKDSYKHKKS